MGCGRRTVLTQELWHQQCQGRARVWHGILLRQRPRAERYVSLCTGSSLDPSANSANPEALVALVDFLFPADEWWTKVESMTDAGAGSRECQDTDELGRRLGRLSRELLRYTWPVVGLELPGEPSCRRGCHRQSRPQLPSARLPQWHRPSWMRSSTSKVALRGAPFEGGAPSHTGSVALKCPCSAAGCERRCDYPNNSGGEVRCGVWPANLKDRYVQPVLGCA